MFEPLEFETFTRAVVSQLMQVLFDEPLCFCVYKSRSLKEKSQMNTRAFVVIPAVLLFCSTSCSLPAKVSLVRLVCLLSFPLMKRVFRTHCVSFSNGLKGSTCLYWTDCSFAEKRKIVPSRDELFDV